MFELGGGAGFTLESLDEFGVKGERERQNLDGDFPVELALPGPVHDGHAAPAQLLQDLVLATDGLGDDVEFRDLAGGNSLRRRGDTHVEATTRAVLGSLLGFGAAPGAEHCPKLGSREGGRQWLPESLVSRTVKGCRRRWVCPPASVTASSSQ